MTDGSRPRDRGAMEELGRTLGETAGRMAGMAADMAAEVAAPLMRSAADVLGGWWSEQAARDAARDIDPARDRRWQEHYAGQGTTGATSTGGSSSTGGTKSTGGTSTSSTGRSYEDVRPYYQLGHTASRNPAYASRDFGEVEPDLQRVWDEAAMGDDSWPAARGFVEFGYGEGQARASAEGKVGSEDRKG